MLTDQKQLFSLPEEITYLNGAYMAPQLKASEAIGIENLRRKNHPYAITSEDFFSEQTVLKKRFAELVQISDYRNVALIPSVSYGIANVANNVTLAQGEEIVLVDEQFPSNVYVWKQLAKKKGASLKIVAPPQDFTARGEQWNKNILKAITSKTAVVAMPHVHWADGTLFNLKAVREKTREVGSLLIIDGTQSVGALPFSVAELQPDALICAGYKWLLGGYSLGVAYYGDVFNHGDPIEHSWMNRLHSENFSALTQYEDEFLPKAGRYSMGEASSFILVPMLIKALEQLLEWQPKNIQNYCGTISMDTVEALRSKDCFVENDAFRAKHLFGIYLPKAMSLETIKQGLVDQKIYVSYRGNAIRVSCNVYNTEADLKKLLSCF
ncbi:aminotransferase class V-fold PLP-dependent enzyme [Flavobacteriaceae bacterium 3-367]|uniref:aminotransferase class V-fold PLP-dependent enzyme n=1 Tax=Eudoraea algarum TaxID=3417568 RepID=UPI0032808E62